MTAMILQILFPDSTSFESKVLIAECVTLNSHKKNQSYFLNWLRCYHYNDSVPEYLTLQRHIRKVLNVTARNREEHFQPVLSSLFMFIP